jgi:subfamily B ATP-binding cassette protein HlyB/CyaB
LRAVVFSKEDVLLALATMCQLQRVPFDASLLLREFPPPHTLETLLHAAHRLGFDAGVREVQPEGIAALGAPCLALFKAPPQPPRAVDETAAPTPAPATHRVAVLVRATADEFQTIEPGRAAPDPLTIDEFAARFDGVIVQFAAAEKPVADADTKAESPQPFGFRWFVPELLKHRRIWRDIVLASAAIQLLALATPLFTQVIIDKVVVHQTVNTLLVIGVALAVVMLFNAAMGWVRQYLVLHTGNRVDAVLGTRVFDHLLGLPVRYFEHRPTGTIVARVHGVETIREFVSGAAVTLLLDLPFLAIFLALMFWYSWQLTLIALAILAMIVTISILVVPLVRARLNHQFLLGARNQAFLTEYIAGMDTVKSLQMEPQLRARYGDFLASYLVASFNTRQLSNSYSVVANALEQLMTLLILCAGAWIVMQNVGFTIGMLVAFQMFAGRLSQPVLRLVGLWQEFQQAAIAVKRLGDIMNMPSEPHTLVPGRASTELVEVDVQDLAFRYGESLPYLYERLNVRLRPGACVALTGPSGSGKSTLARLMQGFYTPSEGRILVNRRDTRSLAANELRGHFGVVPQETVLFSGTIYDNLILANPHATFQQVIQACRMAEIHEVIERLPDGYQTAIGEHGVGLSGGQRQRLAIARALLKRPRVLIFDEATSNLDQDTAEQFGRTVNQLKGRVTMLFIAHQLPRGLQVDEVIRLGSPPVEPKAPLRPAVEAAPLKRSGG